MPAGGLGELHGEGFAVEGRGEVDDVGLGCSCLEQGAVEPGAGVVASDRGLHVAVVLEVVADDQCGAVGSGASAADALAGSKGFDGDAVAEDNLFGAPDGTFSYCVRVGLGDQPIIQEFGLEVVEVGSGLVGRVGDDPDVGFAGVEGFAEGIGESGDRRLCAAAWAEDVLLLAAVGDHVVQVLGHPLVHGGGWLLEVVGEVGFAPSQETWDRSQGAGVRCQGVGLFPVEEGLAEGLDEVAEVAPGEVGVGESVGFFGDDPGVVVGVGGEGVFDDLEDGFWGHGRGLWCHGETRNPNVEIRNKFEN